MSALKSYRRAAQLHQVAADASLWGALWQDVIHHRPATLLEAQGRFDNLAPQACIRTAPLCMLKLHSPCTRDTHGAARLACLLARQGSKSCTAGEVCGKHERHGARQTLTAQAEIKCLQAPRIA
jgi:hypothetical protein